MQHQPQPDPRQGLTRPANRCSGGDPRRGGRRAVSPGRLWRSRAPGPRCRVTLAGAHQGPRCAAGVHVIRRDDRPRAGRARPAAAESMPATPDALGLLDELGARPGPAPPTRRHPRPPSRVADLLSYRSPRAPPGRADRRGPRGRRRLRARSAARGAAARASAPRRPRGDPRRDLHVAVVLAARATRRLDDRRARGHRTWSADGRPGSPAARSPGRARDTACLRCVDAHEAEHEPRRPLHRAARRAARPRSTRGWRSRGVGGARRGVVLRRAEASDLVGHRRRSTSTPPEVRDWQRHPHCGCAWDLRALLSRAHQYSRSSLPSIERRCSREQESQ